ncbi:MAG: hypothetical protein H0T89_25040 [Deltaproteobacteria bacterium]|nr:hypothetical protein [Deltaproteobacteria bacterium]
MIEPVAPVVAPTAPPAPPNSPWLETKGTRIRLYGFARLDLMFTDSRLDPNNQFPFFVSPEGTIKNDAQLDIHPRLSRIGIEIERDAIPMVKTAKALGKLELDFQNGGSESREIPRLRHAYLEIKDKSGFVLLAGQTWDLISPLWPSVNSDSLMWNAGNLGDRRPQLRLGIDTKVSDGTVQALVAVARTGAINNRDLDMDGTADGIDSGKPMIQARVGVTKLLGGKLSGGVWGHISFDDTDADPVGNKKFQGRSVGADLLVQITKQLAFAGEVWLGENLDDVRGGVGQGVNVPMNKEIRARGGWAEVRVKPVDWYTLVGGASVDDPKDEDLDATSTAGGGARKQNRAIFASNHFNLGGGIAVALEYIYWKTQYLGPNNGNANRVNLWLSYGF